MLNKSVYLCGPITGMTYDEATEEREYLAEIFKSHGVEALSPMRGKIFFLNARKEILRAKGYEEVIATDKAIVKRDKNDVMKSGCILADLRGAKKVSIGSMIEFGWADAFGVPIITCMTKEGAVHDHGFVHQLSTYVTDDMAHAVELTLLLLNAR